MMGSGDGNLREVIVLEPDEANGQPSCSTVGLAAMMSVPCARSLSLSLSLSLCSVQLAYVTVYLNIQPS